MLVRSPRNRVRISSQARVLTATQNYCHSPVLRSNYGKTSFSCRQHRNRCTESTKFWWQPVIGCFKERDTSVATLGILDTGAGDGRRHTGRPGVPLCDTRDHAARVQLGVRSWTATAGGRWAQNPRGPRTCEHQPPSQRPQLPPHRESGRWPHSPWGQGRKT